MNIRKSIVLISLIFITSIVIGSINITSNSINNNSNLIINSGNRIAVTKNNIGRNRNDSIGKIIIPKIKLEKELYNINSYYNNVDYNIEINNKSNMPNVIGGNLILEAHSGNSYNSFFRNLYKIKNNDEIDIIYNNYIYKYNIDNIYYINKNGKARIKRDFNKSTITLITCTKDDDKKQTIYIGYLKKKECLN